MQPGPGGVLVPSYMVVIEPIHMRSDESRPGDLYDVAGLHHAKDLCDGHHDLFYFVTVLLTKIIYNFGLCTNKEGRENEVN